MTEVSQIGSSSPTIFQSPIVFGSILPHSCIKAPTCCPGIVQGDWTIQKHLENIDIGNNEEISFFT